MASNTGVAIIGTPVLTSMEGKQSSPSTFTMAFTMSGHKSPGAVTPPEGNLTEYEFQGTELEAFYPRDDNVTHFQKRGTTDH